MHVRRRWSRGAQKEQALRLWVRARDDATADGLVGQVVEDEGLLRIEPRSPMKDVLEDAGQADRSGTRHVEGGLRQGARSDVIGGPDPCRRRVGRSSFRPATMPWMKAAKTWGSLRRSSVRLASVSDRSPRPGSRELHLVKNDLRHGVPDRSQGGDGVVRRVPLDGEKGAPVKTVSSSTSRTNPRLWTSSATAR